VVFGRQSSGTSLEAKNLREVPMLVILGALKEEIADMRSKMIIEDTFVEQNSRIYKGKYRDMDILLGQTGIGKENAERATEFILGKYPVSTIISLGFSGALVDDLKVGNVVLNTTLHSEETQQKERQETQNPIYSDANLVSTATGTQEIKTSQVSSVTMANPIVDPEKKLLLGKTFHAEVVDMESYWIARKASASSIPFLGVRAISDTAKDKLPPFDQFLNSGKWQWKKGTFYFLTHPKQLIKLFFLYRNVRQARKNLTLFMDAFIPKI